MSIEGIRQGRADALARQGAPGELFAEKVFCGVSEVVNEVTGPAGRSRPTNKAGGSTARNGLAIIRNTREVLNEACQEARQGRVSSETMKGILGGTAELVTKTAVVGGTGLALAATATVGSSAVIVGAGVIGFLTLPALARRVTDIAVERLQGFSERLGLALRERF